MMINSDTSELFGNTAEIDELKQRLKKIEQQLEFKEEERKQAIMKSADATDKLR
jgi:tetrahydromethanopterin S-methyltransferase subunit G